MTQLIGWLFLLPTVVIVALGYGLKWLADHTPKMAGDVKKQAMRKASELASRYRK